MEQLVLLGSLMLAAILVPAIIITRAPTPRVVRPSSESLRHLEVALQSSWKVHRLGGFTNLFVNDVKRVLSSKLRKSRVQAMAPLFADLTGKRAAVACRALLLGSAVL